MLELEAGPAVVVVEVDMKGLEMAEAATGAISTVAYYLLPLDFPLVEVPAMLLRSLYPFPYDPSGSCDFPSMLPC